MMSDADESFDLFVSYAHADDADGRVAAFVDQLKRTREARHYSPWRVFFDRNVILTGHDWERRLASVEGAGALLVFISPRYFASEWCRREYAAFREREKRPPVLDRVFPIYLATDASFDEPVIGDEWRKDLARRQFLDLRAAWFGQAPDLGATLDKLERTVADVLLSYSIQSRARRATAPLQSLPLPPHFIERPAELATLQREVLALEGTTEAVSVVFGLGGVGKSTLVASLVRLPAMRDRFEDGMLWATLGQQPDVRALLGQWIVALGDRDFRGGDPSELSAHLRSLLQDRAVLLVIDDAWHSDDVKWFLAGGPRCRSLVTTRNALIVGKPNARLFNLDVMAPSQSLSLLERYLGRELRGSEKATAVRIASTVGQLPLALELVAAQVSDGVAWDDLLDDLSLEVARLESLDLPGADEFRQEADRKRHSLTASLNLSLARLTSERDRRARFAWLGVLPEDAVVTARMAATLWQTDERSAHDTLVYLREKALLVWAPAVTLSGRECKAYRLHDILHDAARRLLTSGDGCPRLPLREAHAELLRRYRATVGGNGWQTLAPDGYIHARLACHLCEAGDEQGLHALLCEETADGRNVWFEACERVEHAAFASDLARAAGLAGAASRAGDPNGLVLAVRYALINASLNSMANNASAELLAALVRTGVWSADLGLSQARREKNPADRARKLIEVASVCPPNRKQVALREALAACESVEGKAARAAILRNLLLAADPELQPEVLAASARLIKHDPFLAQMICAVAPSLSPENLDQALHLLRSSVGPVSRAKSLIKLLPLFAEPLRPTLAREAAECCPDDRLDVKAEILAAALPYLAAPYVVAEIDQIVNHTWARSEANRAEAVRCLAPFLDQKHLAQFVCDAELMEDDANRALALARLAPNVDVEGRPSVVAKALAACKGARDPIERGRVTLEVAPLLTGPKRDELLLESLFLTRDIRDGQSRAKVLIGLARLFDPLRRAQVFHEIGLLASERIIALALREGAALLPPDLFGWVLKVVAAFKDPTACAGAVAAIARCAPPDVLMGLWAVATKIPTEPDRAQAMADLAPLLPPSMLPDLRSAVGGLASGQHRSHILVLLAAVAAEADRAVLVKEATAAARLIEDSEALARMPASLREDSPGGSSEPVAAEMEPKSAPAPAVWDAARWEKLKWSDERAVSLAIADLAPVLPEEAIPEAWEMLRKFARYQRAFVEAIRGLASRLSPPLLQEVRRHVRTPPAAMGGQPFRGKVLTVLLPAFSGCEREAVVREILDAVGSNPTNSECAAILRAVYSYLTENQLQEAFALTRQLPADNRVLPLREFSACVVRFPLVVVRRVWRHALEVLGTRSRRDALADLQGAFPLVRAITPAHATPEVVRGVLRAVEDVGRWFP
jgi:hypothetical protein